jgi:hypothetical protein
MRHPALFAVAGALLLATSAPALAGQLIVVEARGVSLAPGSQVDDSKPLVLKQGQHVTLISQSGTTIVIDGPNDKPPSQAGQGGLSLGTKLAALTTESGERTGEVGTTRGTATVKLPDPWLIDASHAGIVCLREGTTPVFWRAQAAGASTLVVMPDDRSWKVTTKWPAGQDRLSVETNVPMHGGASYFISLDGAESAIAVSAVPASLSNDAVRAAWMADKGCEAQAEALARTTK